MTIPWTSSIHSGGFQKFIFLPEISFFWGFEKCEKIQGRALLLYELFEREPGLRFTARCHRARVFPIESNTKTIAERAKLGPRTPVLLTMEILFLIMFGSNKCLLITIIVLHNAMKFWIEIITFPNDTAMEKFYRVWVIFKSLKFSRHFQLFFKI